VTARTGRDGRRSRGAQAGFTLIEMIVVIAIMGLLAGVVLVRQPWHSAGLDLDVTERALTSAVRLARARAIVQGRDVTVITGAGGFSLDGGAVWALPAGQAMSAVRLVFTPDGESSGGTVLLASAGARVAMSVNWLTGLVQARHLTTP
jgi:general secretion pathway protein H